MRQSVQQQQEARTYFPSKVYYRRQRLVVVGGLSPVWDATLVAFLGVSFFGVSVWNTLLHDPYV